MPALVSEPVRPGSQPLLVAELGNSRVRVASTPYIRCALQDVDGTQLGLPELRIKKWSKSDKSDLE
jgi:hypothetical protein